MDQAFILTVIVIPDIACKQTDGEWRNSLRGDWSARSTGTK